MCNSSTVAVLVADICSVEKESWVLTNNCECVLPAHIRLKLASFCSFNRGNDPQWTAYWWQVFEQNMLLWLGQTTLKSLGRGSDEHLLPYRTWTTRHPSCEAFRDVYLHAAVFTMHESNFCRRPLTSRRRLLCVGHFPWSRAAGCGVTQRLSMSSLTLDLGRRTVTNRILRGNCTRSLPVSAVLAGDVFFSSW